MARRKPSRKRQERRQFQREAEMLMEIALRRGPRDWTKLFPPEPSKARRRGKDTLERLAANIAQHPNLSKGRRAQMLGVHRSTVIRASRKLKPPPQ
jgi:hypothetical protein